MKAQKLIPPEWQPEAKRSRCFLRIAFRTDSGVSVLWPFVVLDDNVSISFDFERHIVDSIHLSGSRGNPQRTYSVTAVGGQFQGTFEEYSASVIMSWQESNDEKKLDDLNRELRRLGLTWKVVAQRINETQVELQVGRLLKPARGGNSDLVSIADVGFGVSQSLPVLVALHVARPGQLVYLEQPEIHLHPRAQVAMAEVLANAANRGVMVVAETHSNLLLLGIQTLVAEGKITSDKVKLHWFTRSKDGSTHVSSTDLDERGTFGDWPEDFADVSLNAETRFLNAAEKVVSHEQ
jgi:AAA domain, putative AbiEii toxin, Type IV TA system/Protein of unknown function (DUF3696)